MDIYIFFNHGKGSSTFFKNVSQPDIKNCAKFKSGIFPSWLPAYFGDLGVNLIYPIASPYHFPLGALEMLTYTQYLQHLPHLIIEALQMASMFSLVFIMERQKLLRRENQCTTLLPPNFIKTCHLKCHRWRMKGGEWRMGCFPSIRSSSVTGLMYGFPKWIRTACISHSFLVHK